MAGIFDLPAEYHVIKQLNMQKDKKLVVLLNVVALIIAIVLVLIGLKLVPISFVVILGNRFDFLIRLLMILVGMILYILSHELIHGLFIRLFSGKKAKYGFTGLYAYAGTDAYFTKRHYLTIALAPVVLFGVTFLLLNIFLPSEWFWFVYLLQILNVSGAAGDLYVTYLMQRLPKDILVQDRGIEVTIYSCGQ